MPRSPDLQENTSHPYSKPPSPTNSWSSERDHKPGGLCRSKRPSRSFNGPGSIPLASPKRPIPGEPLKRILKSAEESRNIRFGRS